MNDEAIHFLSQWQGALERLGMSVAVCAVGVAALVLCLLFARELLMARFEDMRRS